MLFENFICPLCTELYEFEIEIVSYQLDQNEHIRYPPFTFFQPRDEKYLISSKLPNQ